MIATPFGAVMVVRTNSQVERSNMGIFRAVGNYGAGIGFQGQSFIPQMVVGHHRIAFVLLHAEYCHIVVSSFQCKFDRQQGRSVCPADRDTLHTHSIDISNPGDRSGNCRNHPARSPRRLCNDRNRAFPASAVQRPGLGRK